MPLNCSAGEDSWKFRRLKSPGDSKEIKPVNLKGDQPWIYTGRTDAETEAPVFWPSDVNGWLIGKVLNAGKDWRQEEKGMTEDEMVGWHHQCNEDELGQTPGDGEGQGGLACCSPWGRKELDTTEQLHNNNNNNKGNSLNEFQVQEKTWCVQKLGEGQCGWCAEWLEKKDEAREIERAMCKLELIFIPKATGLLRCIKHKVYFWYANYTSILYLDSLGQCSLSVPVF